MKRKNKKIKTNVIKKISFILIFAILLTPAISTAQIHSGISNPFEKISTGINEIKDSINETKEFFAAINKFITTVTFPIKKISSLIGGSTLILLFFILIISSGLGALGIPKGKFTFFTALLIADSLWLAWGYSINSNMFSYFLNVVKINIILLSPFIIYLIIKKYFSSVFTELINKISLKSKKRMHLNEAKFLSERFSDESLMLLKKLSKDMGKGETNDKIILSDDSRNSIRSIKKLLGKFPGSP